MWRRRGRRRRVSQPWGVLLVAFRPVLTIPGLGRRTGTRPEPAGGGSRRTGDRTRRVKYTRDQRFHRAVHLPRDLHRPLPRGPRRAHTRRAGGPRRRGPRPRGVHALVDRAARLLL